MPGNLSMENNLQLFNTNNDDVGGSDLGSNGRDFEVGTSSDKLSDNYYQNESLYSKEDTEIQPGLDRILVPVIYSIVVFFGCIGNIIVIIVVIRNKDHFRNTTNLFILNLSIADLLFLTFCVPFHAIIYTTSWPFGTFMCKFVHLVQFSSMVASILTLVAMAADRYLAVAYALETKHLRTPVVALVTSCVIWLIALAIAMPQPIMYEVGLYDGHLYCYDNWRPSRDSRKIYYLILFILGYILPSIAIFILSVLIIRQLWMTKQPEGPRMKESINKKRKVTRLIIVVVIVFCLCWLPSHVIWIWTNFFPQTWDNTYFHLSIRLFAHVLSYGNSAVNPVIYAFLSANFRRGFQRAILCRNVQPTPVQRFTFTKSSQSNHHNGNGCGGSNHFYNRYSNISNYNEGVIGSSYSDTCV